MNITAIRFFNPVLNTKQQENKNYQKHFNLVMAPPLKKDTVSFKATPKGANRAWDINYGLAKDLNKALKEEYRKVENFMTSTFDDLIATETYPKNPISMIKVRLKSDTSIQEKSGTRQWTSVEEILENMTDLIGAKIVMRNAAKHKVDLVLDRFIPLIKSGKIELLEIENKRPRIVQGLSSFEASKYDYASLDCLKKMIDIQENKWKEIYQGKKRHKVNQNLENDFTHANYSAIHFLFRLPGKHSATFELQLMGDDVNKLKDIDDVVWKKLDGKNSTGFNEKFNKLFAPLTDPDFFANEPNGKEIAKTARDKFNQYRGELFLFQRNKDALPYSKRKKQSVFLPLQTNLFPTDIEIKYNISSADFDFNNIAEILTKKAKKASAKSNSSKKTSKNKKLIKDN